MEERASQYFILICELIALICFILRIVKTGGTVMDYIAIATILLAATTAVINLRSGNKRIDEVKDEEEYEA